MTTVQFAQSDATLPYGTPAGGEAVLSADALAFLGALAERFSTRVAGLLERRRARLSRIAAGEDRLAFASDTDAALAGDWRVPPAPPDLVRRVVEITGPTDPKMLINALNSGADVFMADLEDATSPTWSNVVLGQENLRRAVLRTLQYEDPRTGKQYRLRDKPATLVVRPRGWHLVEAHCVAGERPLPAPLFDFGLYLFHNAPALAARGTGPYFYLPKLEAASEAALWRDVFEFSEDALGIAPGTIRATVLIETLPAVFEMDEILYALGPYAIGLNCGRWDYIFSHIKTRQHDASVIFPDRSQITMTQPCMRAYTQLAVRTCHRRHAYAIGGMAAQIPISGNPAANDAALERVRDDKRREVADGHDGTWVAHPALVPVAREAFEASLGGKPNQLDVRRPDVIVTVEDLLRLPVGTCTLAGLELNVRVGIQYLEAWLRGQGAVALYHLMEDAATAEISRAQVWQWIRHRALLDDGRVVTEALLHAVIAGEMRVIAAEVGAERFANGRFNDARSLFVRVATGDTLSDFLTLQAYPLLDQTGDTP